MGTLASRDEVQRFIDHLRYALAEGGYRFFLPDRDKNREALTILGINPRTVKTHLMLLRVEDYCEGPNQDPQGRYPGFSWIFRLRFGQHWLYVKLKIIDEVRLVKCLSFHPEEYGLKPVYDDPGRETGQR